MTGRVHALHRFPVKSMTGEQLDRLECDARGVVGDRIWSVRTTEGKIGSGKNTRRFATVDGLLRLRAASLGHRVQVTLPAGRACFADESAAAALVSQWVGQPVTLARETEVSHFDDGPVSLVGLASVDAVRQERGEDVDPVRCRANILVSGWAPFAEDELVGRRVRIGTVVLDVVQQSPRCVMVDLETADLPEQKGNLRAIGRLNDANLGVIATVVTPGSMATGDLVEVLGAPARAPSPGSDT